MSDNDRSSADPFGEIADEFVEAFRQGKRPSVEEFAHRYPEHADDIRAILPALLLMEKAKSSDGAPGQQRQATIPAAAAPLRQVGDYQILREVGRGGRGREASERQRNERLRAPVRHTSARTALPPICFGYVAKLVMWCPSAFLREFPHDRSAVGHITPRPTPVEIGLAVLRLWESVLAVFDWYAIADAFQRALLATTTSDSRRPFRPAVDARYVAQDTAEELPFSPYEPPPAHNCEDHITDVMWSTT
jgi:hypothetical protein